MEITTVTEKFKTEIQAMDVRVQDAIYGIRDERTCDIAADIARQCADQIDIIEKTFAEPLAAAKNALKSLEKTVDSLQEPYRQWKKDITGGVSDWRQAERDRIADENRKATAAAAKEAKEKADREAAKLEKKGEPEMAAVVRDNAACFAPPLQEMPRNKGVIDKVTWNVHVDELQRWKLIKFLVEGGPANANLIKIDEAAMKRLAQMRHEEMKAWPAVRVFPVTTSEIRRERRIA